MKKKKMMLALLLSALLLLSGALPALGVVFEATDETERYTYTEMFNKNVNRIKWDRPFGLVTYTNGVPKNGITVGDAMSGDEIDSAASRWLVPVLEGMFNNSSNLSQSFVKAIFNGTVNPESKVILNRGESCNDIIQLYGENDVSRLNSEKTDFSVFVDGEEGYCPDRIAILFPETKLEDAADASISDVFSLPDGRIDPVIVGGREQAGSELLIEARLQNLRFCNARAAVSFDQYGRLDYYGTSVDYKFDFSFYDAMQIANAFIGLDFYSAILNTINTVYTNLGKEAVDPVSVMKERSLHVTYRCAVEVTNLSWQPRDFGDVDGDGEVTASFSVIYDASGGTGAPAGQTKTERQNLTLSGAKPAKSFTLSFDANGGTVSPASKTVSAAFTSWNTKADGDGTYYAPGGIYSNDSSVTLYALWTNPAAGDLPTPTRAGYTFSGWFTAKTGGTQVTEATVITGSQTLYARWTGRLMGDVDKSGDVTAADARLALREAVGLEQFSADETTVADMDVDKTVTAADARLILRTAVGLEELWHVGEPRPLQKFFVSYDATGGTGAPASQTKTEGKDLTLSAAKPAKSYTVSYDANGGSVSPASKTVNAAFKNWNTQKDGKGTSYAPGGIYKANADVTLYAQWTDPAAGDLPTPTRADYTFAGWFTAKDGGTQITKNSAVTGNITLFAHWTAVVKQTFTVTYNASGGTGAPAGQTKTEGKDVTLSAAKPAKSYTVTYNAGGGSVSPASKTVNAAFKNWNTQADGSGTAYAPGGTYKTDANVTLFAQWTDPTAGDLPTPTRADYTFAGWFTAASGGTEVTKDSTVTGNITLYAHWTKEATGVDASSLEGEWVEDKPGDGGNTLTIRLVGTGQCEADFFLPSLFELKDCIGKREDDGSMVFYAWGSDVLVDSHALMEFRVEQTDQDHAKLTVMKDPIDPLKIGDEFEFKRPDSLSAETVAQIWKELDGDWLKNLDYRVTENDDCLRFYQQDGKYWLMSGWWRSEVLDNLFVDYNTIKGDPNGIVTLSMTSPGYFDEMFGNGKWVPESKWTVTFDLSKQANDKIRISTDRGWMTYYRYRPTTKEDLSAVWDQLLGGIWSASDQYNNYFEFSKKDGKLCFERWLWFNSDAGYVDFKAVDGYYKGNIYLSVMLTDHYHAGSGTEWGSPKASSYIFDFSNINNGRIRIKTGEEWNTYTHRSY